MTPPTVPNQMLRAHAWDIIPCPNVRDFMAPLGLIPGSDDVTEMEHAESHSRMERLVPLADRLHEHAHIAAQVVTAVMLRLDKPSDVVPETVEIVNHQNETVIYTGLCAVLSQLINDGTLQLGKVPA